MCYYNLELWTQYIVSKYNLNVVFTSDHSKQLISKHLLFDVLYLVIAVIRLYHSDIQLDAQPIVIALNS